MKIVGWLLFGVGVLLLIGAFKGYFTAERSTGEASVSLLSGLGVSAVPLAIGLVLLSKAEKRDKSTNSDA